MAPTFFHLTINKAGVVSLWDSEEIAREGMQSGEVYLKMVLTQWQAETLEAARRTAKED